MAEPDVRDVSTFSNNATYSPFQKQRKFLPWSQEPFNNVSLSASGLLALADLSTIARRTALTGNASWFDAFVLAPGIHYQQRCETLNDGQHVIKTPTTIRNSTTGQEHEVTNQAMLDYLHRVGAAFAPSRGVTLAIKSSSDPKSAAANAASSLGLKALSRLFSHLRAEAAERGYRSTILSPLLYASVPLMTAVASGLMIAIKDWWGCAILAMLMIARLLNIFIIRRRTAPPKGVGALTPPPFLPPADTLDPINASDLPDRSDGANDTELEKMARDMATAVGATDWTVTLPNSNMPIRLRGLPPDLEALTSGRWMREKTNVEGYMEAAAKLIVYLVAAFSGNMYQTGNIILGGLLLISAAALALSNSDASHDHYQSCGKVIKRLNENEEVDGERAVVDEVKMEEGQTDGADEKEEEASEG